MATPKSKYQPGLLRYVFDPFEGVSFKSKSLRDDAAQEIADFVLEQTLSTVGDAKSPVTGRSFPALSKGYEAFKKEHSSSAVPNLELNGDMLDALKTKVMSGGLVALEIEGEQAEKADGHCKLTGRDNPSLKKKRRFIPDEDESFSKPIMSGIEAIVKKYQEKDQES